MSDRLSEAYYVSGNNLKLSVESDEAIADDPRGIVHLWEEPKPGATYVMGVDPAYGLTGWSRATRMGGDHKTDNSAIEIIRIDAMRIPIFDKKGKAQYDQYTKQQQFLMRDLQVCEFAGPVDAVEIGRIANVLGRVYAGDAEDQCECILESFPGPGPLTLQEMLRLDYMNMWHWEYIADGIADPTRQIGWHASQRSVQLLWARSRRHLMQRRVKLLSPYLVQEYANAVIDMEKQNAKAAYGFHDDRLKAMNLCLWAGHKWSSDPERSFEPVTERPMQDWQTRAPVLGESLTYSEAKAAAMDGWD